MHEQLKSMISQLHEMLDKLDMKVDEYHAHKEESK